MKDYITAQGLEDFKRLHSNGVSELVDCIRRHDYARFSPAATNASNALLHTGLLSWLRQISYQQQRAMTINLMGRLVQTICEEEEMRGQPYSKEELVLRMWEKARGVAYGEHSAALALDRLSPRARSFPRQIIS
jgi:hypothetical protein